MSCTFHLALAILISKNSGSFYSFLLGLKEIGYKNHPMSEQNIVLKLKTRCKQTVSTSIENTFLINKFVYLDIKL